MRRVPANIRLHRLADSLQPRVYLLLLAALVASVLPFFALIQYAHPSADDFCYAADLGHGDLWHDIKGEYLGWKGRYSAIFLTAVYHQAGGMLATYSYALALYLAALVAALYAFVASLTEYSGSRLRTLFLTLGLGALYLGTMPKVPATVYWLDGAFQYQTGSIFVLLALAALLNLYRTGSGRAAALSCVCIFLATGATETAMITLVAVVGLAAFHRMYLEARDRLPWALVMTVTAASSALLVLAPGNFVRAEFASPDAGRFWYSFSHAWFHGGITLVSWLANPALWLATAAFIPAALRMVHLHDIKKDASWRRLALLVVLVPGLTWVFFFALWWAAATNPPGRMLNLAYLLFLCGWFAVVLELTAVLARRGALVLVEELFPAPLRLASLAAVVLFAALLLTRTHVPTAYADLLYRAPAYERTMNDRYATIARAREQAGSGPLALNLPAVADAPRLLMYSDIQPGRGNWRNSCFARYFGLDSVARQ